MSDKRKKDLKIIDLFCGAGGLSLGFEKVGFSLGLANDIDKYSIETFKKNRDIVLDKNIYLGDINNFIKEKKDILKNDNFSIVVGGPPCQGFSMANRQRFINDPRNILYKKYIEVIQLAKPKILVMENVKGMKSVAPEVVKDLDKIGYYTEYKVLNAKDFGIPQNRERLIYIGIKKTTKNYKKLISEVFREIENSKTTKTTTIKDAFWGLRKLSARKEKGDSNIESSTSGFTEDIICGKQKPNEFILKINNNKIPKYIYNHKARYNNPRDLEIFKLLPQGENSNHESIKHIMPYKSRANIFKDKYYKLPLNKPSKTITSHMKFDCNMYIHPLETRGITPREAARIQSFPDNYIFIGPYTQWYHQIGNAVPPLLGEVIARSILKKLV